SRFRLSGGAVGAGRRRPRTPPAPAPLRAAVATGRVRGEGRPAPEGTTRIPRFLPGPRPPSSSGPVSLLSPTHRGERDPLRLCPPRRRSGGQLRGAAIPR